MSESFDDFLAEQLKNPEIKAAYDKEMALSAYYKANPDECPHHTIVAPVSDTGEEQPGTCLDCGAENVMERENPHA
jgi:hypothetical protein